MRSIGHYETQEVKKQLEFESDINVKHIDKINWFAQERELVERRLQVQYLDNTYKA